MYYVDRSRGYQYVDRDRKSTRLNSSHVKISYAVFCLKKKNEGHYARKMLFDRNRISLIMATAMICQAECIISIFNTRAKNAVSAPLHKYAARAHRDSG